MRLLRRPRAAKRETERLATADSHRAAAAVRSRRRAHTPDRIRDNPLLVRARGAGCRALPTCAVSPGERRDGAPAHPPSALDRAPVPVPWWTESPALWLPRCEFFARSAA